MKILAPIFLLGLAAAPGLFASDPLGQLFDGQIKILDGDVVRLAEAMPAEKYNFAPTNGEFKGVRTFGTQVKHIATMLYMLGSSVLGEKPPVNIGATDNGPDSLTAKADIVNYLKGSLAYAHKAAQTLTEKNELEPVKTPFGAPMPRIAAVSMMNWHTFDHYGQMVVYARMNGVIPGANATVPPAKK